MDELKREHIIPVHLNHAEMIECYVPNKKNKSRAGSTPYACKRKKKHKK